MKILILAAGRSSRFSSKAKIFAAFWGISVIDLILANTKAWAKKVDAKITLILNDENIKFFNSNDKYSEIEKILQSQKYGTGAAVQAYCNQTKELEDVIVFPGDMPLIDESILCKFDSDLGFDVCVGVAKTPIGDEQYGRVIFENGQLAKIAEYKDHSQKTEYINTGVIYLSQKALKLVENLEENEHKEVFLTDIVELSKKNGLKIGTVELDFQQTQGFNTKQEFQALLKLAQQNWRKKAQECGAIFYDMDSTFLSYDTNFECGAIIEPNCFFGLGVSVKSQGRIKAFSYVENCVVNGIIGPFAHIKSGIVEQEAIVGSFVEVKNSTIGVGTKIKHLAYIGDADIAENVNIGAGAVICNYDGKNKHRTKIDSNAFIGGNSTLIAPITIGKRAFLAAGSTFKNDVKDDEFSIARTSQTTKPNKNKQENCE